MSQMFKNIYFDEVSISTKKEMVLNIDKSKFKYSITDGQWTIKPVLNKYQVEGLYCFDPAYTSALYHKEELHTESYNNSLIFFPANHLKHKLNNTNSNIIACYDSGVDLKVGIKNIYLARYFDKVVGITILFKV